MNNQTSLQIPHASSRLEWLDALRGFTMMMVVTNHLYGMSFGQNTKYSMFMSFCLLFRMPLFFFISGFLAYKVSFSWSGSDTWALVRKKLRVQMVPTLVFMTVYIALYGKHFWDSMELNWSSPTKGGYWFTMVLLQMLLIYYAVCFVTERIRRWRGWEGQRFANMALIALWAVALFGYATMYMPKWFTWQKAEVWQWTSVTELVRFGHCFLLGNLCRRYWPRVERLLDSSWFFPLLVMVAFLGATDYLNWHNLRLHWANLPRTMSMYALVLIAVAFFRHYAQWFGKDTRVGATLQYIGVRTLDIYLLHYLFVPHLPTVGAWFKANPHNFVLEGVITLLLAFLVTGFCILTSHVLRVSPVLKKWLFGR